MDEGFRCPRCGYVNAATAAVSEALRAIGGELSLQTVRQKIVDAARELAGAQYAALGVRHPDGGFEQFVTSGMTGEEIDAIGPLPRAHGMLAAMLEDPTPFRSANIQTDPRFGGWPDEHPSMRSFLGVPIVADGEIVGAFYLTDKIGAPAFTAADQESVAMLAGHAVVAIKTARLYERSRELSAVEERNRLARELHDSVSQTLFSVVLTAEAAGTLIDRDPVKAREQIAEVVSLARGALHEMRSLIFELRGADIENDGLAPTLRKHIEVLRRVYAVEIHLDVEGERRLGARAEKQIYRIAQEAMHNALKHARATSMRVTLMIADRDVRLEVADNGEGFDSEHARSTGLGLTSMKERAAEIGGDLQVRSAQGKGTSVCMEVCLGR